MLSLGGAIDSYPQETNLAVLSPFAKAVNQILTALTSKITSFPIPNFSISRIKKIIAITIKISTLKAPKQHCLVRSQPKYQ